MFLIPRLYPAWRAQSRRAPRRAPRRFRRRENGPAPRAPSAPASRFQCAPPWRLFCSARVGAPPCWRWRRVQRTPVAVAQFLLQIARQGARGARAGTEFQISPGSSRTRCILFSICTRSTGARLAPERQYLPDCGWRRSERLRAWIAALGASQPRPRPRVLTRACPLRQVQGTMARGADAPLSSRSFTSLSVGGSSAA